MARAAPVAHTRFPTSPPGVTLCWKCISVGSLCNVQRAKKSSFFSCAVAGAACGSCRRRCGEHEYCQPALPDMRLVLHQNLERLTCQWTCGAICSCVLGTGDECVAQKKRNSRRTTNNKGGCRDAKSVKRKQDQKEVVSSDKDDKRKSCQEKGRPDKQQAIGRAVKIQRGQTGSKRKLHNQRRT